MMHDLGFDEPLIARARPSATAASPPGSATVPAQPERTSATALRVPFSRRWMFTKRYKARKHWEFSLAALAAEQLVSDVLCTRVYHRRSCSINASSADRDLVITVVCRADAISRGFATATEPTTTTLSDPPAAQLADQRVWQRVVRSRR